MSGPLLGDQLWQTAWCCRYNVVGHVKTVIILAGGYIFFQDDMPLKKLAGIGVAMSGIIWYTQVRTPCPVHPWQPAGRAPRAWQGPWPCLAVRRPPAVACTLQGWLRWLASWEHLAAAPWPQQRPSPS